MFKARIQIQVYIQVNKENRSTGGLIFLQVSQGRGMTKSCTLFLIMCAHSAWFTERGIIKKLSPQMKSMRSALVGAFLVNLHFHSNKINIIWK